MAEWRILGYWRQMVLEPPRCLVCPGLRGRQPAQKEGGLSLWARRMGARRGYREHPSPAWGAGPGGNTGEGSLEEAASPAGAAAGAAPGSHGWRQVPQSRAGSPQSQSRVGGSGVSSPSLFWPCPS